jgi:hypothetical protein
MKSTPELRSDYVLEFGSTESSSVSGTSDYVLLANREIPATKEVIVALSWAV